MIIREEIDMMAEVVQYLREEGYASEFVVGADSVKDPRTNKIYHPEDLSVKRIYRFEGEGKLPKLDVLYALQANDGTRGWIAGANDGYAVKRIEKLLPRMRGLVMS
jgi:hypothetical protein